jgi:hypothetical protein
MTVGLAIFFAFILPNSKNKILGVSKIELQWIQWNFNQDSGQSEETNEMTAMQGLQAAVRDPKTWLFIGILYCVSKYPCFSAEKCSLMNL